MSQLVAMAQQTAANKTGRRFCIYGQEGVGKSTFFESAPNALFIPVEAGVDEVNVQKTIQPKTWLEVLSLVEIAATEDHPFKTLVLDSVTALEGLLQAHVCAVNEWDTIEKAGYGKGYKVAAEVFEDLISRLEAVRNRGIHVAFVGHSTVRTFENPEGATYDRYELALHKLLSARVKQWVDALFFFQFTASSPVASLGKGGETRNIASKGEVRRIMNTSHQPIADAKCRLSRFECPPIASLDDKGAGFWKAFVDAGY